MANELKFSVLIPVYYKENPLFFEQALDSILNQTLLPDEIVIVKDGPLTEDLDFIVKKYILKYPKLFNIIALEKNVGLGDALSIGILNCNNEIIARMDSDDIARSDRFEKQIKYLKEHPDIDVLGSWISEFEDIPENIISYRQLPVDHDEIYRFGQFRCPINHMTVMYKKDAVIKAGNYQTFKNIEDYYLWGRMLINGAKFANLPECLVNVRAGNAMFKRRANLTYFLNSELPIHTELFRMGYINFWQYIRNIILKFSLRILPFQFMKIIYFYFLRRQA